MGNEKRRHDRFYVKIPARLLVGKNSVDAETVDISFGGLFVRTPKPPPLRQLVKVVFKLPPTEEEATFMAMAVFVETTTRPTVGVGLQLFGLDPASREKWEGCVRHVRTMLRAKKVPEREAERSPIEEPPAWPDVVPQLWIRLRTMSDLQNILNRELARGRMYVRTPIRLREGSDVELLIVHPTNERTFSMGGRVDARVERPHFSGLRVLLPSLPSKQLTAFSGFVQDERVETMDLSTNALVRAEDVER